MSWNQLLVWKFIGVTLTELINMNKCLTVVVVVMSGWLCGCASISKTQIEPSLLQSRMVERCADLRRTASGFNSRKSPQLVHYECKQILSLDEEYQRLGDPTFKKSPFVTYFDQQEEFDAEAWFMITEIIRKYNYPDYLDPESEVVRANSLNAQQRSVTDESTLRYREPRLLAVSPYLMSGKQLEWAGNAVDALAYEFKSNKDTYARLMNISAIIVKERSKKEHGYF